MINNRLNLGFYDVAMKIEGERFKLVQMAMYDLDFRHDVARRRSRER